MISFATSAWVGFLQYTSTDTALKAYVLWGLGSFSNAYHNDNSLLFAIAIIGLLLLFRKAKSLDILLLGDRYAQSLGVNTYQIRLLLFLLAALFTAFVTAYAGPIAFVGMAVPILVKAIVKTHQHTTLIGLCFIAGGLFL